MRGLLIKIRTFWSSLGKEQKFGFWILVATLLVIPVSVEGALTIQQLHSRAKQNPNPTAQPDFTNLVPLNISQPVYGFTVDGSVNLDNDNAFLRIILIDKSNNEYLVYETYSAISDERAFSVKNACEETCFLQSVSLDHLRIEGNSAKFDIGNTSFTANETQVSSLTKTTNFKAEKDNAKIAKLNELIKKKGLNWVAGETSVSRLTYAQKKKLFANKEGIVPNLQGLEFYKGGVFEVKAGSISPPVLPVTPPITTTPFPTLLPLPTPILSLTSHWDWRNRHSQNWVSPVKDQLNCGSCWAFAAISTTETATNLYYNQILNIDLSEQDSVCKHPGSCTYGGSDGNTLNELATGGLATESCYPYTGTETCPGRCLNQPSQLWKITGSAYTTNDQSDNTIKSVLITKGPVPFGIPSWWHIMTLVGYETEQMSGQTIWIVKNSWGTSWGENGYGKFIIPMNNRYITQYVERPYLVSNPNLYTITCTDKDNDHYCNWGILPNKPASCPKFCLPQEDCDDSNPKLGPYDSRYNCLTITPTPTPPSCIQVGQSCTPGSQTQVCCSGICDTKLKKCLRALPTPTNSPSCLASGKRCLNSSMCCSKYCDSNTRTCKNAVQTR